ncbi:hypothetical protein NQ315_012061 [Exocentrus adspersus]|uniref:tRNA-splicing endonuclease subunit Sen15 domain-containing protein n=1 Tax=Exocentrus adspersus TaxID=1586481 RepID=A0AAV8VYB9_9CUCU|nr:hypothetical protein NQ315_012061 [Exocentrus adspersus]
MSLPLSVTHTRKEIVLPTRYLKKYTQSLQVAFNGWAGSGIIALYLYPITGCPVEGLWACLTPGVVMSQAGAWGRQMSLPSWEVGQPPLVEEGFRGPSLWRTSWRLCTGVHSRDGSIRKGFGTKERIQNRIDSERNRQNKGLSFTVQNNNSLANWQDLSDVKNSFVCPSRPADCDVNQLLLMAQNKAALFWAYGKYRYEDNELYTLRPLRIVQSSLYEVAEVEVSVAMQPSLITKFAKITSLKEAVISSQVYLELCELKRYFDIDYCFDSTLNKICISAKKVKNGQKCMFVPITVNERLNFLKIQNISKLFPDKLTFIVIVQSDSTCVYYQIACNLLEPMDTVAKHLKENKQETVDSRLRKNRALLEDSALRGLKITLT